MVGLARWMSEAVKDVRSACSAFQLNRAQHSIKSARLCPRLRLVVLKLEVLSKDARHHFKPRATLRQSQEKLLRFCSTLSDCIGVTVKSAALCGGAAEGGETVAWK